ncbi:uncharacterized protein FMAN_00213 [Fusarium mangiferae]|uniref:Uncharacterized protein n=1 Tax=Fusarium mangiferae TaxID=192010 RepID=A0A1L7TVY5_FUSMA|nr:uncharacterized protein FMAN_00213 [Fusarium mangiferae]CVL02714.1 uncharacterized protein FMAN_00213 [Fusarium mangiferae]
MSVPGIPDHDAFWGDTNDQMKEKTKAYAESAIKAMERQFLLEQYWHPWRQDTACEIKFNIRIFELMGDHCDLPNGPTPIDNPRDLLMYWESAPKHESPQKTNRRVIIIEDLHPRLVELLGVLLDIPPEFFLAHCEEFVSLSVSDASGAPQGSSAYWKVPVPRRYDVPHRCNQPLLKGRYYAKLGNFNRGAMTLTQNTRSIDLPSFVSYWGKPYGNDSWTSVILVDPHECRLDYAERMSPSSVILADPSYLRDITREFRLGSSFDKMIRQYQQRIFDTVVEAYEKHEFEISEDPFSATIFARNTVRSIWEEFVIREAINVHDIQFDDQQQQSKYASLLGSTSRNSRNVPSYEKYQELMEIRQSIREKKRDLQNIMWSFQCRTEQEEDSDSMAQGEHESWAILEEKLEAAESTLGDHLEMFAQRSALVQAEAANRMARSSGQLTKIATIIVPCSFVASIFSMGGNFAAGEPLFFVYWTISVPITLILLAWVFSNDEDAIDFFNGRILHPVLEMFGKADNSSQEIQRSSNGEEKGNWFKQRHREQRLEEGQSS